MIEKHNEMGGWGRINRNYMDGNCCTWFVHEFLHFLQNRKGNPIFRRPIAMAIKKAEERIKNTTHCCCLLCNISHITQANPCPMCWIFRHRPADTLHNYSIQRCIRIWKWACYTGRIAHIVSDATLALFCPDTGTTAKFPLMTKSSSSWSLTTSFIERVWLTS